ncbi:unnamed protein product [Nippostrongylus brasiliensis]|uniref:Uncharacterized protein n=1 Tax=Nippostrongylus brasiliensis TaxID=27835 RepID=A0A0N4Y1D9_NIPBR|nr:unnamed protein product [Nippostrongylus brasiliensis]
MIFIISSTSRLQHDITGRTSPVAVVVVVRHPTLSKNIRLIDFSILFPIILQCSFQYRYNRVPMRLVIFILSIVTFCFGEYLYILIDDVKLYPCKGDAWRSPDRLLNLRLLSVKNEIKVIDEDVSFLNEKGNKVYYIRAPGNYSLHFKKVTVEKDFGFLAGEIGATLQVPLIQGPAGFHFDYPHTIVPETGLFYQHCDEHSGIVERNGRQYCRYCDLCGAGEHLESKLNDGGHQFFPLNPTDASKTPRCGALAANEYEFKKTISLPAKGALQDLFNEKMQGMDAEMRRKFSQGSGRFQVSLNLITTDKPSIPQDRWFERSKETQACPGPEDVMLLDAGNNTMSGDGPHPPPPHHHHPPHGPPPPCNSTETEDGDDSKALKWKRSVDEKDGKHGKADSSSEETTSPRPKRDLSQSSEETTKPTMRPKRSDKDSSSESQENPPTTRKVQKRSVGDSSPESQENTSSKSPPKAKRSDKDSSPESQENPPTTRKVQKRSAGESSPESQENTSSKAPPKAKRSEDSSPESHEKSSTPKIRSRRHASDEKDSKESAESAEMTNSTVSA